MKENFKEITARYAHIAEAVRKVKKIEKRGCIIMPTGSGKTLVMTEYLFSQKEAKVLFLVPQINIGYQALRTFQNFGVSAEIEIMTYSTLLSVVTRGDLGRFLQFTHIILDEFHRLGAERWGEAWGVVESQLPEETKIIGLTATETRYLDGGRDMCKELFEGKAVVNISLRDAFLKKFIFKAPRYVYANYTTSEEFSEMTEKATEALKTAGPHRKEDLQKFIKQVSAARVNWEKSQGIPGLIKRNLNPDARRILVFYFGIAKEKKVEDLMRDYFEKAGYKNLVFYHANSGHSDSVKQVEAFNAADTEDGNTHIMLSINMLNEGIHVKDCHNMIMFRSTMSPNIFMQQIGRVMSLQTNVEKPVILDLVNNITNITSESIKGLIPTEEEVKKLQEAEREGKLPLGMKAEDFIVDVHENLFTDSIELADAFNRIFNSNYVVTEVVNYIRAYVKQHGVLPPEINEEDFK